MSRRKWRHNAGTRSLRFSGAPQSASISLIERGAPEEIRTSLARGSARRGWRRRGSTPASGQRCTSTVLMRSAESGRFDLP